NRIQWLFVGDPAQLPPVGEAPSPALEQPGPMLTEVVRQARDNPILDMATKVREGEPYLMSRFENGKGVGVTRNADGFLASAIDAFKRGDDARVLCYRNRTVNAYNNAIRTAVHGDEAPRFVPGDKLMARTTYFTPKMKIPLLNNSEEVVVVDAYEDRLHRAGGRRIAAWLLDIITADGREVEVPVLHEDAVQDYRDRLKEYRDEAKTKGTWSRYYKLAEAFADVEPCYAMTVHKSQGSTFHTVYVDHRDLMACRTDERQALTYVAVTRPSHRLALLV
ncbi:MAG: ATP-dependent RecD-like DNA helicase, partial [Bacteroidota bacterium]